MQDTQFLTYVRSHKGFSGQLSDDLLLDNPAYLASLLIYLQSKNIAFPSRLQRLLGAKKFTSHERAVDGSVCYRDFCMMMWIHTCVTRHIVNC